MSVGGMAVIASYGTSVATVTVTQGLTFSPAEQAASSVPSTNTELTNITISNAGNMNAKVNLIGVIYNSTNNVTTEDITVTYGIANPVTVPAMGSIQVTENVIFGQTVSAGVYNITTTVTPAP